VGTVLLQHAKHVLVIDAMKEIIFPIIVLILMDRVCWNVQILIVILIKVFEIFLDYKNHIL